MKQTNKIAFLLGLVILSANTFGHFKVGNIEQREKNCKNLPAPDGECCKTAHGFNEPVLDTLYKICKAIKTS